MDNLRDQIETYAPYLEDISRRLRIVTFLFIIFFIIGVVFSTTILKEAITFFNFKNVTLNTTSPFQLFDLALDLGMFIGLFISIPVIIYHLYAFIKSALKTGERQAFLMLIPLSGLLFLLGFVYGFFILYSTVQLLADVNVTLGIKNVWDISLFLASMISTSALLGLIFQFPIIFSILIRLNIIGTNFLKQKRRQAVVLMFVFTSLLPPTDGISLILMVLPLIVMYELTIMYNNKFYF